MHYAVHGHTAAELIMQRNKALISGRDGEIWKLNLVECIGSSVANAASIEETDQPLPS